MGGYIRASVRALLTIEGTRSRADKFRLGGYRAEHLHSSISSSNHMDEKGRPFQIAILLYPGVTALDGGGAVGSIVTHAQYGSAVCRQRSRTSYHGGRRTSPGSLSYGRRNSIARSGACTRRFNYTGPNGRRRCT